MVYRVIWNLVQRFGDNNTQVRTTNHQKAALDSGHITRKPLELSL